MYFMTGTLCKMAFKELWKVRNIFYVNARYYYNASECNSDYHLMWVASLKKRYHVLVLVFMRGESIHGSIDEDVAAILGNLHLILVYYRSHYSHTEFQPTGTKIGASAYEIVS